ncbi:hypothetical protein MGWOODY_Mmi424 [hydrothermal vent metagenome]|jgi:hypothetical protein|uniref:Uncharacterized protein n=2 Tax=ecological metagenomes TaxID=410657 RepID=A0A160VG86_9ZZZZ
MNTVSFLPKFLALKLKISAEFTALFMAIIIEYYKNNWR